jgi:hypothetical protein
MVPLEVYPCDTRLGHIFEYAFDVVNRTCVKVVGGCAAEYSGFAVEASCIDICWDCMSGRTRLEYRTRQDSILRREIFIKYFQYKLQAN